MEWKFRGVLEMLRRSSDPYILGEVGDGCCTVLRALALVVPPVSGQNRRRLELLVSPCLDGVMVTPFCSCTGTGVDVVAFASVKYCTTCHVIGVAER